MQPSLPEAGKRETRGLKERGMNLVTEPAGIDPALGESRIEPRLPVRPGKRLLYVAAVLPPTRVPEADHVQYQCVHFARQGIDVHVVTRKGQDVRPCPGVTVHELMDTWSWSELPRLVHLLRTLRPDAVMMSFLGSLYQYRTMPTLIPLLSKLVRPGAPFVVQFANLGQGGGLKGPLKRFLFRALKRFRYGSLLVTPDVFIALSEDHRQKMLALAPSIEKQIHIIPCCPQMPIATDPGAAREAGRARLGIGPDDILVSFFGRLYPGKGIEPLIEAVAGLRKEFPQLRLGLIGGFLDQKIFFNMTDSYEHELRACVERHGMTPYVVYSGEYEWDGPDVSTYLFASDIAALPLGPGVHLYNSSFAAICAHGVATVGTKGKVVDAVLRHDENIHFIPDAKTETISQGLRAVLENPGLRRKLGEGAAALAEDQFSWELSITRLARLMRLDASAPR